MERKNKCSKCGKTYVQDWARENHEKRCKGKKK